MNKLEKNIFNIFKATPIDIVYEEETIATTSRWRLSSPRLDTLGQASTNIGLFNLWYALKEISDSTNIPFGNDILVDKLTSICDNLIHYGLLQEDPEYKRQQFTLITNEELNGKRNERGPYSRPEYD